MDPRPPLPPFTEETARQKVQAAEDAWNTCDPDRIALACRATVISHASVRCSTKCEKRWWVLCPDVAEPTRTWTCSAIGWPRRPRR